MNYVRFCDPHRFLFRNTCKVLHKYNFRCVSTTVSDSDVDVAPNKLTSFLFYYSQSPPVFKFQESLIALHDYTGLSWPHTIIMTTVVIRTVVLLPLFIHQQAVAARLSNLEIELTKRSNEIHNDIVKNRDKSNLSSEEAEDKYNKTVRELRKDLVIRYNCHPFKMAVMSILNVPIWITFSAALRNLVHRLPNQDDYVVYSQLVDDGILWVKDLTVPDKILPCLVAAVNLLNIQLSQVVRLQSSAIPKIIMNGFRIFIITLAYFGLRYPSFITTYWLTSALYVSVQNLVLMSPRVKKFFAIPITPHMRKNPYGKIIARIKNNYKFWFY